MRWVRAQSVVERCDIADVMVLAEEGGEGGGKGLGGLEGVAEGAAVDEAGGV